MEASTTLRDDALECLKLRSLFRFVRSSSLVLMRSRPVSVLPVRKSGLMPGAGCSTGSLRPSFSMLLPNLRHFPGNSFPDAPYTIWRSEQPKYCYLAKLNGFRLPPPFLCARLYCFMV